MFSFYRLQVSTCTFLVILVIGMSSALSIRKEVMKRSVPSNTRAGLQLPTVPKVETSLNVNDADVQQFARFGLKKYAANKSYEPMIVKINSATLKFVKGNFYKINVTFGETNCAKGQKKNCVLNKNAKTENCIIEALAQLWVNNGYPTITVTCS